MKLTDLSFGWEEVPGPETTSLFFTCKEVDTGTIVILRNENGYGERFTLGITFVPKKDSKRRK